MFNDCAGFKRSRLRILGARFKIGSAYFCVAECECGSVKILRSHNVMNPKCNVQSCGCLNVETRHTAARTHGFTSYGEMRSEYRAWAAIKARCHVPTSAGYYKYGAKGISVCDRWRDSFENFIADMGVKPSPQHSIDRIDPRGNYEASNCRWATVQVQSRNKTNVAMLTFYGMTKSVPDWADISLVPCAVINNRLRRGYPAKMAVWTPAKQRAWHTKKIRVSDAALAVLRETGNHCVQFGDETLLHLIAERLGWPHEGPKTSDRVMTNLLSQPRDLVKVKTARFGGRGIAVYLPESVPVE